MSGLTEGYEYEFRVSAENAAGTGPCSDSSLPALCKEPIYSPGPPGTPKMVDSTKRSVTISWKVPSFDGGADVSGYHVEICPAELDVVKWSKCTPSSGVHTTEYTISDLQVF